MLSDASACADGAPRCVGICSPACDVYPGDCSRDLAGTWTGVATLDQCKARCRGCARCRSISFDAAQKECLWFFDCQADGLFRARFAESFTTVRLKPAAPPSWASRNASSEASQHDRCEIWPCRLAYPTPLATRATAQRRGTTRTLRMSTALATEGPWLSASMAARGVRGARNNSRLACFFGRARRRPVHIVALGGSITAGLSYGPGLSHAASDEDASQRMPYQYHAVFERWVRAAFARHGSGEHSSRNLGVPANGPALFATCLSNLAGPVAPDLALLEFGVNTEPDDLPAFEALLRGLHRANVPTVVVNVDRFGPWDHCKWAHCRDPSSFARYEPDSQVLRVLPARPVIQPHACACAPARLLARVSRVAEQLLVSPTSRSPSRAHAAAGACPGAIARRHGVAVVNLRHAVHEALTSGQPHFAVHQFMSLGDCRHVNGQGHRWLAQLLSTAVLQAAHGAAPGADAACAEPAWLPSADAVCLRGSALKAAVIDSHGFRSVGGRKPGLRCQDEGSWVRLRVPMQPANEGAFALVEAAAGRAGSGLSTLQLGYQSSWRCASPAQPDPSSSLPLVPPARAQRPYFPLAGRGWGAPRCDARLRARARRSRPSRRTSRKARSP